VERLWGNDIVSVVLRWALTAGRFLNGHCSLIVEGLRVAKERYEGDRRLTTVEDAVSERRCGV